MQSEHEAGSLQGKFQGFGAAPSDALWGNIAGALDEKKKRRGFYWWWIGSAMAAAITLVILAVTMSNEEIPASQTSDVVPAQNDDSSESLVSFEEQNGLNDLTQDEGEETALDPTDLSDQAAVKKDGSQVPGDKKNDKKNSMYDTNNDKKVSVSDFINQQPPYSALDGGLALQNETVPTIFEEEWTFVNELRPPSILLVDQKLQMPSQRLCRFNMEEKPNRNWEYGFSFAYWNDVELSFKQESAAPVSSNNDLQDNLIDTTYGILQFESAPPPTGVSGTVRHSLSIDGFIGKYFGKRWAWRAGLGFSRTNFKTNFSSFSVADASSNLTTLKLPLSIRFDMVQKQRYKMRAGLGLHNEIPFREKVDGNYTLGAPLSYSSSNTVGYMGGLQLDVASEWRLKKNLSLTLTPSYRWYFTQNVGSQNALVKRDHWLGIAAGVSWEF